MDIRKYMSEVPDIDRFLTVDEMNDHFRTLAESHADIASLERVGTSQLGEPVSMLSIGNGPRNILLFACPHPNEPIGAMLTCHLAQVLCEDSALRESLPFSWHLISSVDPDGTRLNEAWFSGPFTIRNYARNFYRPAGHKQVEWTFPNFYKLNYFDQVLPETQMLMRVIDRLKPELMGSLHNAGFGGVYYYLSKPQPDLYSIFHELPAWEDLPLRLGEGEVPWLKPLAEAIFPMISVGETYEHMEANGADMTQFRHGGSSAEYASQYGTQSLIIEMAYFDDPRVNDHTVTNITRRQSILDGLDKGEAISDALSEHLNAVRRELKTSGPVFTAVDWFTEESRKSRGATRTWAETDEETLRPATVAELFTNDQETRFYRLLIFGMLVRLLEGEITIGNGTPNIRKHHAEASAKFDAWLTELENDSTVRAIPIRKLVAVQLGAVLAAASSLT